MSDEAKASEKTPDVTMQRGAYSGIDKIPRPDGFRRIGDEEIKLRNPVDRSNFEICTKAAMGILYCLEDGCFIQTWEAAQGYSDEQVQKALVTKLESLCELASASHIKSQQAAEIEKLKEELESCVHCSGTGDGYCNEDGWHDCEKCRGTGLKNGVRQIERLKEHLASRDARIEELETKANKLDEDVKLLLSQIGDSELSSDALSAYAELKGKESL